MGARGPAKKPTNLSLIQGNPGKRKLNNDVLLDTSSEVPKPLVHLDTVAKKEWKRLAPVVFKAGLLTDGDLAAFGSYCAAYSSWYMAEKNLQAKLSENNNSMTFETEKGYQQQIPEIGIANQARLNMVKIAREFGLTPSSRAGISTAEKDDSSSIMEFVKGRKSG